VGIVQVSLSWTTSTGGTSSNAERASASGGPYTTVAGPTTTIYTDTGLTDDTIFYGLVSAW